MFLMFIHSVIIYDAFASKMIRERFRAEKNKNEQSGVCTSFTSMSRPGWAMLQIWCPFSNVPQTAGIFWTNTWTKWWRTFLCLLFFCLSSLTITAVTLFSTSHHILCGYTELTFPDKHFSPITFRNITLRFLLIHFKATYEEAVECKHVTELSIFQI